MWQNHTKRSPEVLAATTATTTASRTNPGLDNIANAEFIREDEGPSSAFQSRHAAYSMSANASPSGLCDPSTPTFSGSTTGESQPSEVKCGVRANADDADGEGVLEDVVLEDGVVEEEEEDVVEEKAMADVPFMAKRAERVSSACGINVLLPVKSARW
jgi:hypothetical protein